MTIVLTPNAPHPKAQVELVDLALGVIRFRWLNAASEAVDTGGSTAAFNPSDDLPTEAEVVAAIEASTA